MYIYLSWLVFVLVSNVSFKARVWLESPEELGNVLSLGGYLQRELQAYVCLCVNWAIKIGGMAIFRKYSVKKYYGEARILKPIKSPFKTRRLFWKCWKMQKCWKIRGNCTSTDFGPDLGLKITVNHSFLFRANITFWFFFVLILR